MRDKKEYKEIEMLRQSFILFTQVKPKQSLKESVMKNVDNEIGNDYQFEQES